MERAGASTLVQCGLAFFKPRRVKCSGENAIDRLAVAFAASPHSGDGLESGCDAPYIALPVISTARGSGEVEEPSRAGEILPLAGRVTAR